MSKSIEKLFFIASLIAGIIGVFLLYLVTRFQDLWIDRWGAKVFVTNNKSILTFADYITELGSKPGIVVVALISVILLWLLKRDYTAMAIIALAIALGNEVNKLLKNLVGRERPSLEHLDHDSLSFPSGHAMVGIILYMLIAYFLAKYIPTQKGKWLSVIVCLILVLILGMSRLILNVHYPSDVIAGYAFGFIWAFLWIQIYGIVNNWMARKKKV
ncbi:phosphatase PAP2 family protein [Pseudoneobacillus sp. C159]